VFAQLTLGQSTYLYQNSHADFGLEPMAIILSLPWALLMWSYVISSFLLGHVHEASPLWIGW
jgi:hypothetical protein